MREHLPTNSSTIVRSISVSLELTVSPIPHALLLLLLTTLQLAENDELLSLPNDSDDPTKNNPAKLTHPTHSNSDLTLANTELNLTEMSSSASKERLPAALKRWA